MSGGILRAVLRLLKFAAIDCARGASPSPSAIRFARMLWRRFSESIVSRASNRLLRQPVKLLCAGYGVRYDVLVVYNDSVGRIGGPVGRIEARGGLKSATTE